MMRTRGAFLAALIGLQSCATLPEAGRSPPAVEPGSSLVPGNKLALLQNGPATYAAMFAAIHSARDHINLETYIFDDDEAGQEFSRLLLERQAAGVQVNIIHDSVGGLCTPAAFFDRLKAAGINVLEFNPVNPLAGNKSGWEWELNSRDHRRQLIVDGRVAFAAASTSATPIPARRASGGARSWIRSPSRRLAGATPISASRGRSSRNSRSCSSTRGRVRKARRWRRGTTFPN